MTSNGIDDPTERIAHQFRWHHTSSDPRDEQFGDVVERTTLEESDTYDAVLVGEPYDGAVIGRPGAREGPAAIRSALNALKSHHFTAGTLANIADLGTVKLPDEADVRTVQSHVRELTAQIHDTDAIPVFLGGDNSLTYPNVAPLLDRGTVGAINVDAHLDCRIVDGQPTSGSPYRQLFEAGLDSLAVVGARHFETATTYASYLNEQGGELFTAETVGEDPVAAGRAALDAVSDCEYVYVSVDVDVLDVTAAPGVSAPTPGGLTSRELFRLVRVLTESDALAGFELVETAPPLCPDGRTAEAAARTVAHALAGFLNEGQTAR